MPTFPSIARRTGGLACAALLAAAAAPSASRAAFAVGEQIDRGDGTAGASPWYDYNLPPNYGTVRGAAQAFAISEDGRYAFLTYPTTPTTRGLYRRDVQANTLRLVIDDVVPTGRTASGSVLSVVTSRALAAADTNATADLYLVDPFTGAATLASKSATGAALGSVSNGAVTADGTAVVYSVPGGTDRRVLTSATATRMSTRALDPLTQASWPSNEARSLANLSREGLSADGTRAVLVDGFVATPAGDVALTETGRPRTPVLAPDGSVAVRRLESGAVAVYTLATRARREVTPVLPAGSSAADVLSLSADGRRALVGAQLTRDNSPLQALGSLDLATGAVVQTSSDLPAAYPVVFSSNDRYGIAADSYHLFAVPAVVNAALPGGTDPASPNVYLAYEEGCLKPVLYGQNGGRPSLTFSRSVARVRGYAVIASQLAVNVRQLSNGAIINRKVLNSTFHTSPINAVFTPLKLESTASFSGGRTTTDVAYVPAYTPFDCYGNNGF